MSGHVRPERPVTFVRNRRSRWSGKRIYAARARSFSATVWQAMASWRNFEGVNGGGMGGIPEDYRNVPRYEPARPAAAVAHPKRGQSLDFCSWRMGSLRSAL